MLQYVLKSKFMQNANVKKSIKKNMNKMKCCLEEWSRNKLMLLRITMNKNKIKYSY